VVLITLDTTRADHLGAYGYSEIETPHLDRLAADGVLFQQAVTSVPLTLPAHTSLMTGTYPFRHGVRDNAGFVLGGAHTTLAECLRLAGYRTLGVVGSLVLNRHQGLDQGFERYDDRFRAADRDLPSPELLASRDGAEVVERALGWWGERAGRERVFLWVHLFDPHYPYAPPVEFAERYRGRPYDGEIAYVDSLVGQVVARLKKASLYDSTLLVVAGDHGEGLDQHSEPAHGVFLYESTLHIPLIIRTPDPRYRGRVGALVRDIDVMPTVLDYLGLPLPDSLDGRSVLPLMAGGQEPERRAYAEAYYTRFHFGWSELRALRSPRYKYIEAPTPELYDLVEDPRETVNVLARRPEIAAELRSELQALVERHGVEEAPAPQELDPESLAALRALGYVGSFAPRDPGVPTDPKDKLEVLGRLLEAVQRTREFLAAGQPERAAERLEALLAEEPRFMDGYQDLAACYRRMGRRDRAVEALQQGLSITPDSVSLLYQLAKDQVAMGHEPAALATAERILDLSPGFADACYLAADLEARQGRFAEAIRRLRAWLKLRPEDALAHYEIGRVYLRQGKLAEARETILRTVGMRPEIEGAHFNLALIEEQLGNHPAALRAYEQELQFYPASLEAWTNLGILRRQLGEVARSEEAFRRIIDLQPDRPLGYYLLAETYAMKGRFDGEVLTLARKAARLDPGFADARKLAEAIEARIGSPSAGTPP
jgi:arylsulfatase A-like enzyme/Tfp pilus assembly protein PilF